MDSTPSGIIASQVRKRRRQLNLTRQQLAEQCASIGTPQLTLPALTNIETGRLDGEGRRRRKITVDELITLAIALKTSPIDLMIPSDMPADTPYNTTPARQTTAAMARDWIGGTAFLTPPNDPGELAEAVRGMPPDRAQAMVKAYFAQQE